MKKYVKIFFRVITALAMVVSILAVIYSKAYYKKTDQISSIIHTIYSIEKSPNTNVDSLKNELVKIQFEKETYINQLSLLSDWVILYVSVLFAVFGFVGITFVLEHIKSAKEDSIKYTNSEINKYRKEINEQKIEIDKHKNEFKELKKVVYNGEGNASFMISEYYANHNNLLQSVLYAIIAARNFKQASILEGQDKIIENGITANNLKIAIKHLETLEKDHLTLYITFNEDVPNDVLKTIHKVLDELFIYNDEHLTKLAAVIKAKLMNIAVKI